jgi:ABC-type polysaccharide/polyol phosphate transport system ATPase subunit
MNESVKSAVPEPILGEQVPLGGLTPDRSRVAISVQDLGKQFWLQHAVSPTFQETLVQMVRGVESTPFWALRDVSFNVGAGEAVGIIGSNGAGKSTLLRLLCGLGRPTTGEVRITGRVAALLELGAGFSGHLTGRQNLYTNAIVSGLRRREVDALFDTIVDFAEMRDFMDQPARTYSSGMKMRLMFSIAIHVDPAVMIIDEVLAVGDAHFAEKCQDRINAFRQAGKTMVIASHSLKTVELLCNRALWLRRGSLIADGPSAEITARYKAVIQAETLSASREAVKRA